MKKLFLSLICFFTFFNGVYQTNSSGTQLFDSDEAIIEIDSARINDNDLQIAWTISGVENIDQVVLSVREITPDGLVNEPLELINDSALESGVEIITWDGSVNLSLILKIITTNYSQYSGPDCDSIYCYRDITTEITSDEYIINKIPDLPPVPTTIEVESNQILEIEKPPKVDNSTNITFTNELITTIPLFSDIDFSDQAKNTFAFLITSGIIFLFYGVLLAQEWFNRIIAHYRVRWTSRKNKLKEKTTLETFMEVSLVGLITALLYAFVEEGFTFQVREENLAIFLGVLFGLIVVTFCYEGIESLIEYYVYDQIIKFDWNPQAMFFAILSTILFIVIDLPFGFILGFIAAIHIVSNRPKAELSPKFYSMMSLSKHIK